MPSWIRIRNLYADPDPAAQINADPCRYGSGSETLKGLDLLIFWVQIVLATFVAISEPKKSRFSGPTPLNSPRIEIVPIKIITSHAIEKTSTLIVNLHLRWAVLNSKSPAKLPNHSQE